MHEQQLPILSHCSKFYVSTSNSVIFVPSSSNFLWPLLDLDQCPLSQHTVFIPELLMVCSEQEIYICINKKITPGLTDLLHQDPLNHSEKHRGMPLF